MKYLPTDFCILKALSSPEHPTVADALAAWQPLCGYRPPLRALADALSALVADDLINIDCDNHQDKHLNPDALVHLTDKGREAVTVSGVLRALSALRERAERKLELNFCDRERPVCEPLFIDCASFGEDDRSGHVQGFQLADAGDGLMTLTIEDDDTAVDDEMEDISTAAVTTSPEYLRAAFLDLLDVAEGLLEGNARARKVALHGVERSLVLTFARAACEDGVTALHVTAAPLRFNRARFVGKRDSDLDYAQCGDPILSAYWSPDPSALARTLLPVMATAGHTVIDETLAARIQQLYRAVR